MPRKGQGPQQLKIAELEKQLAAANQRITELEKRPTADEHQQTLDALAGVNESAAQLRAENERMQARVTELEQRPPISDEEYGNLLRARDQLQQRPTTEAHQALQGRIALLEEIVRDLQQQLEEALNQPFDDLELLRRMATRLIETEIHFDSGQRQALAYEVGWSLSELRTHGRVDFTHPLLREPSGLTILTTLDGQLTAQISTPSSKLWLETPLRLELNDSETAAGESPETTDNPTMTQHEQTDLGATNFWKNF